MGAADGLERTLIAIAARCLRVPAHELDPSAPLTRYGLDSLTALELAEAVATETGRELGEAAFQDAPSIEALALRLLLDTPAPSAADDAARVRRMRSDAVLEGTIDPRGLPAAAAGAPVLLTGANGFLGTHVLRELLAAGASGVICLVRAEDDCAAAARLEGALARYGVDAAQGDGKVRVIAADIAAPAFGLSADRVAALAREAGAILHCAAEVNWAASYESLRDANVEATRSLLRFATTATAKPFHFVSSVAACYSTRDPVPLDETSPAADPAGLHLGYGQTKWVAERLVEVARARGLRTAIYRPSLVAGDAATGIGNDEDLLSRLLRGCVELGHAPDLDWPLDACPVGFVARALARSLLADEPPAVLHLRNAQPAYWSEAVLWMNLRGHAVRLEPYARWVERVRREASPDHALNALRGFLSQRPRDEGGRYLAELYARPHVRALEAARSDAALAALGVRCPRIGAEVLSAYFEHWVGRGLLRAPARSPRAPSGAEAGGGAGLAAAMQRHFGDDRLRLEGIRCTAFGSDHSLIGELGSWRAGRAYRMQACVVDAVRADGRRASLDLVLKPKLDDATLLDVTAETARLCDPALGRAFEAHRDGSEFAGARGRELAVYAGASGALRTAMPLWFGTVPGEPPVLVLERVRETELPAGTLAPDRWTRPCVEAALSGIASVHAQWLGDARAIGMFGLLASPRAASEAACEWRTALAVHAGGWLRSWLGGAGAAEQLRLAAGFGTTERWIAGRTLTLVHGDFNPRNLAIRYTPLGPRLAAFDWELAGWGLPQRDVVELLCFVLDPDGAADEARRYVERSRLALQRFARRDVDAATWHAGVRAAIGQFGATRLPMYFLAHRFRPQAYLERVARCWWRLASALGAEP